MTKLLIPRHGETQWNTEKRMQGRSDSPLTDHGIWQAQRLAGRLKDERIEGRPLAKHWDPPVMEPTALNIIEADFDAYHIVMYADSSHTRRKVS